MQNQLAKENMWVENAPFDSEAFEKLYDHYFPRIYNFIFVRVLNSNVADDLTSEVFEKVLTKKLRDWLET
jgi:DNA-directed RNA polymerase specialized sigma24 family protein